MKDKVGRTNKQSILRNFNRDLKIEVFLVSRKPKTSKRHVNLILPSRLTFEVHGSMTRTLSSGKS